MSSEPGAITINNSNWSLRPAGFDAGALRPLRGLATGATAGEWIGVKESGEFPRFRIPVEMAPGIYQLRFHLSGEQRAGLAVFVEEAGSPEKLPEHAQPLVEYHQACNEMSVNETLVIKRQARALQVEIRMSGKILIREFSLKTQPPMYRAMRTGYRFARAVSRPFVRVGRIFWAFGRVSERELVPSALLQQVGEESDGSKKWRSLGRDPFFSAAKNISGGWVRVRSRIESERGAVSQFFYDAGHGFQSDQAVFMADSSGPCEVVRYVNFVGGARAVRLDPVDAPIEFTLRHFSVEAISDIRMWIDAFFLKLEDMRSRRNFSRSLKYGLKLLLKFNFVEFREKLFPPDASVPQNAFNAWRVRHALTPDKIREMRSEIEGWKSQPLISIIMPVYNVPEVYLRKAMDSVIGQIYPHWELCIADDCSTAPHVRVLLEEYAKKDARIKVAYRAKNGHISAASNTALELATGEFIATLDNDDELTLHALYAVARAIVKNPSLDFIYSDEDKIDMTGRHIEPFFKPDWSPEYFLACMYTCHLGIYRTALVRELGGYRSAFDTAQDYDLVLRVTERSNRIHHIQDILYHWRMLPTSTASGSEAKPKAHVTAQRALSEHLARMGERARVEDGPSPGFHRVRFEIVGQPKISIIIPSTCGSKMVDGKEINYLELCIASILEKSSWRDFEIIILDRNQMPAEMQARYEKLGIRRVTYSEGFNWSSVNNLGAKAATGTHLLFLNDDMEVISADWLESLLEFSQRDGIGAVGGKLFFPDGRIQHAGVVVKQGKPGHPYYCHPGGAPGYFCSNIVHRNCLVVTGACLMTRKDVFESVGGLNENFPLNYNDVDYCLKVIMSGKRIVYTPYSQLFHHESVSRPKGVEPVEIERFEKVWLERFPDDPYLSPHLTFAQSACIVKV